MLLDDQEVILMGDFNFQSLTKNELTCYLIEKLQLKQLVTGPIEVIFWSHCKTYDVDCSLHGHAWLAPDLQISRFLMSSTILGSILA